MDENADLVKTSSFLYAKSRKLLPLTIALAAAALFAIGSQAKADIPLEFSGGNGSPLTITLTVPVSFTITTAVSGTDDSGPYFTLKNVGSILSNFPQALTNVTYSINSGSANAIYTMGGDAPAGGDSTAKDVFLFGDQPTLSVGDIVTLTAGTLTAGTLTTGTLVPATTGTKYDLVAASVPDPAPTNGNYEMIITDGSGNNISSAGVTTAVPEPSALLLFGFCGLALLVFRKRRAVNRGF